MSYEHEWVWKSCETCGSTEKYVRPGTQYTCITCKWADNEGRLDSNGLCHVCGLPDGGCNCAPASEEEK
jgi:hypothetical protein